jgi:hypothetical protein
MKRILLIAAAVSAAFVLVASIVAGANTSAPRLHQARTIRVVEHATTDKVVDIGETGDSPGDLLTFRNKLYDATDTSIVGHDQGGCVRISPALGTWQCSWTNFLAGGQINVEGPFSDTSEETVLAVNGGTGTFQNVRGEMELHVRAGGTKFLFVFRLIP